MIQGTFGHTWETHSAAKPLLVTAMHTLLAPPAKSTRWRHRYWVVDYNYTSLGRVRVGDGRDARWWPRDVPTAHLYAPGVSYVEHRRAEAHRAAYLLIQEGEAARLNDLVAPPLRFARFLDPSRLLGRLLRDAAFVGQTMHESGRWRAQAILFEIIHTLHRAQRVEVYTYRIASASGASAPPRDRASLVASVKQYLARHVAEPVTLRDIADHVGVSESSLSHRYRAEAGTTPMTTLLRTRVDIAKGMLLKGHPLKLIATQTGFADAFHLSRTFKRLEGMTATDYRRAAQVR